MTSDHNSATHTGDIHRKESTNLISAERVKGTAVYDSAGEKIGTIDSVMLTKNSGKVAYAIMSFGGFLGMGEKYHPLPWHMLDYDTEVGGYRVGAAGASLKDAPAYDRDALEQMDTAAGSWQHDTDSYYGRPGESAGSAYPGSADRSDRM